MGVQYTHFLVQAHRIPQVLDVQRHSYLLANMRGKQYMHGASDQLHNLRIYTPCYTQVNSLHTRLQDKWW